MGSGIAQVCAAAGYEVVLSDADGTVLHNAGETIAACVSFDPDTLAMTPVPVPPAFLEKIEETPAENLPEPETRNPEK